MNGRQSVPIQGEGYTSVVSRGSGCDHKAREAPRGTAGPHGAGRVGSAFLVGENPTHSLCAGNSLTVLAPFRALCLQEGAE